MRNVFTYYKQAIERPFALNWLCQSCQRRIALQHRRLSSASVGPGRSRRREPLPLTPPPAPSRHSIAAPLETLVKPIGQPEVPQPGDNPHYDLRPFSEKLADYFDKDEAYTRRLLCTSMHIDLDIIGNENG